MPFKNKKRSKMPVYQDVDSLVNRRFEEAPKPGDYLFDYKLEGLKKELEQMSTEEIQKKVKVKFNDLPISKLTKDGLAKRNFQVMTEVQRCVIPHALADRDILGASKTGSGKTLAYLIPLIEKLYVEKFNPMDGLGGLILCPTRELALQVFEVMSSIMTFHPHLTLGLVIGGKSVEYEKEKINRMNILIATPGRLLQHMDESVGFDSTNLRVLVIDEVDMLLDMGFENTLNSIIKNLPKDRQTLVFSATLNKSIHNLARFSMKRPEYISLHEKLLKKEDTKDGEKIARPLQFEIPKGLTQYCMTIKAEDKLDTLFSFLRSHTQTKSLVFFTSIKQVRFAYEAFRKLNLSRNLPLFELHGKKSQPQRMAIFFGYKEKKHASMFTTNIAARGLDFPSVDWVIQVDCPEDTATYIHRIGRTARYKANGKSLLLLNPSEEKFLTKLKSRGLSLNKIQPNPNKALTIKSSLQSFLTEDVELKHLAQKSFMSYMRGVYLMADKEVFDVTQINAEEYAASLGLIQAPIIKFVQRAELPDEDSDKDAQKEGGDEDGEKKPKKKSKLAKLKEKIKEKKKQKMIESMAQHGEENEDVEEGGDKFEPEENFDSEEEEDDEEEEQKRKELMKSKKSSGFGGIHIEDDDEDDDDEFLKPKKKQTADPDAIKSELKVSKRQLKKIKVDGHFAGRNKIMYDEDGNKYTVDDMKAQQIAQNIAEQQHRQDEPVLQYMRRKIMNEEADKLREKQRIKEKKLKKKLRLKAQRQQDQEDEAVVTLGNDDDDDDEEGYEYGDDEDDDYDE